MYIYIKINLDIVIVLCCSYYSYTIFHYSPQSTFCTTVYYTYLKQECKYKIKTAIAIIQRNTT